MEAGRDVSYSVAKIQAFPPSCPPLPLTPHRIVFATSKRKNHFYQLTYLGALDGL